MCMHLRLHNKISIKKYSLTRLYKCTFSFSNLKANALVYVYICECVSMCMSMCALVYISVNVYLCLIIMHAYMHRYITQARHVHTYCADKTHPYILAHTHLHNKSFVTHAHF